MFFLMRQSQALQPPNCNKRWDNFGGTEATLESLGCWMTLTNKEEDTLLSGPMMDEQWLNGEEHR